MHKEIQMGRVGNRYLLELLILNGVTPKGASINIGSDYYVPFGFAFQIGEWEVFVDFFVHTVK